MKLIKGKKIANSILNNLKRKLLRTKKKPTLTVILVGENKVSKLYIKLKNKAVRKMGIGFALYKFKATAREKDIIRTIKKINEDNDKTGIIVQLPLPKRLNADKIIKSIKPQKDADGFHPRNIKKFLAGKKIVPPVFPAAIMKLLESTSINLKNKKAVVLANSEIFGKIMQAALGRKGISSRILSRLNLDKKINLIKNADIIITAIGKPKLIKGRMIKKGTIIIDGGITKRGRKTLGDVDFNSVVKKAGYLSPVPGGVGPVTVACLLENVYKLALRNKR